MTDHNSAYEDNLRHVVEPASPSERGQATGMTIEDYEALWLSDVLREHAHYNEHDHGDESGIAVAYASYIDQKVRAEGHSYVTLYAHTDAAIETLVNAILEYRAEHSSDLPRGLYSTVEREVSETFIEMTESECN